MYKNTTVFPNYLKIGILTDGVVFLREVCTSEFNMMNSIELQCAEVDVINDMAVAKGLTTIPSPSIQYLVPL